MLKNPPNIINGSKSKGVKAMAVGTFPKSDPVVNPSPFPQNEVITNIKAKQIINNKNVFSNLILRKILIVC